MAVKQGEEFVCSWPEVMRMLKEPPEAEVLQFAAQKGLSPSQSDGLWRLKQNDLKDLAGRFLKAESEISSSYKLPDYLTDCKSPWAKTLVDLYRSEIAWPVALSPDQGQFLKTLVCNINPQCVLEVGCFVGISTIWLASGLEQNNSKATLHSVDLFNPIFPWPPHHYEYVADSLAMVQNTAQASGLAHRIKLYKSDSKKMAFKLGRVLHRPIDFLYIDGDHRIPGCLADFALYHPRVAPGGYIVLHDIYPDASSHHGPRFVIDKFIRNSPHFEVVEMQTSPANYGMALIRQLSRDPKLMLIARLIKRAINLRPRLEGKPAGRLIKALANRA